MSSRSWVVPLSLGAACLLAAVLRAAPATAQELSSGTGASAVVSVAWDFAIFGDDRPRGRGAFGFAIGGQVWYRSSESTAVVLEVYYQLNALENPQLDESFRSLFLLVGVEKGGADYLRPAGGVAVHFWEGPQAPDGPSFAFAAGLAGGHHFVPADSFRVSAEGVARFSIEHGVIHTQLGFQLPVGGFREGS